MDRVLAGCLVVAGCGLVAAAVAAVALPTASWFVFDRVLVLVGVALALLGALAWWRTARPSRPWFGTLVGTTLGAAQAVVSAAPYGWDAGMVHDVAHRLAGHVPPHHDQLVYLAHYPNNLPLVAAETLATRAAGLVHVPAGALLVAGNLALLAVVLQAVGVAVASRRPRAVAPAQALTVLLVGCSPALAVPYSDLPAAAGAATALALAVTACAGWRGALRWALAGTALGAAVALKPFAASLAVAALLVACHPVTLGGTTRRGRLARTAAGGLALAATVTGVAAAAPAVAGVPRARLARVAPAFPVAHFLVMGTYDSPDPSPVRRYGAYRQAQVGATAAAPTPAARDAMLRATIARQVRDPGFAGFLAHKVAWVWGDGTFWAQGEGPDARARSRWAGTPLAPLAAVTRGNGPGYRARSSLVQGVWVVLLGWLGFGLARRPRRDVAGIVTAVALAALVQTAYLAVFEARSRYLLWLVPCLVVAAALVTPRAHRL